MKKIKNPFGTFTENTFKTEEYAELGIRVETHFFEKDEFFLPDGRKVYMHEADEYIKANHPDWYAEHMKKKQDSKGLPGWWPL